MGNKPTLIIDQDKVSRNIDRMLVKVKNSNIIFRPHFKTHQSIEIGNIFRAKGIDKITVSSVSMATYFAENGWKDISIAFPVNLLEIDAINALASKIQINLLVDSIYSTRFLTEHIKNNFGVFIKIDVGYHRNGLLPEDKEVDEIIEVIPTSDKLDFMGFLTHAGHTYSAKGKEEILEIMDDASQKLNSLKSKYINHFPGIISSYGDTPSCSLSDDFAGFDEIRPGNFVYYDVMQYHIGSCTIDDIAVAVACPVVSIFPERNELVIYGGAIHLSKEFIAADNDFRLYGYIVEFTENGWSAPIAGAYVSSISQEQGIVKMPSEMIEQFKPGDVIGVLPIHSCLTANLLRE